MIWFISKKLLGLLATLFVAAAIIFFALDVLPGDPARFILGINATPDSIAALQQQLGLDRSPPERFFGWLGSMLKGDFGISTAQGESVGAMIAGRLGVTLPLAFLAMLLAAAIGIGTGYLAGQRRGSLADRVIMALARFGKALPNFWLGMLLVLLFALLLRWLPPAGFVPWNVNPGAALASLILPALALALPQAAMLAYATRNTLTEVEQSDYFRVARAKGLTTREALRRHGLRNAALPLLSLLGRQFASLVAATVIVENVFYLPGLGRLIFDALTTNDLIVIRAALIVLLLAMAGTTFLLHLATAWADPRLRARALE